MTETGLSLAGPGCIRPVCARWVIMAQAILDSPAHFGGQGDGPTDMSLLRDARTGQPLLPGTTLAGALRSNLADILGGYGLSEQQDVSLLFGMMRRNDSDTHKYKDSDTGRQSPLIVFDSLGNFPRNMTSEIRDGVALQSDKGTVEEHKKFDFEVIPAGITFPVRFELVVEEKTKEIRLLNLLRASLLGLATGEMILGARRSRGLGRMGVRGWRIYRYDLSSPQGWLTWLLTDTEKPIPVGIPEAPELDDALRMAWAGWNLTELGDNRKRVLVNLQLQLSGSILVRSPGTTPDAPDVTHLVSGGKPVLSGTSLAGALRNRALRIARIVRKNQGDGKIWISNLFGTRFEGNTAPTGFKHWASRLLVSESVIEGGLPARPSRVHIDRFTQGVDPGALFDEEPIYGGTAKVQLELRNPKCGETGLLFLVIKDILFGDLAVGGASSIGRGFFKGKATIQLEYGTCFDVAADETPGEETLQHLNKEIRKFHEATSLKAENGVAEDEPC